MAAEDGLGLRQDDLIYYEPHLGQKVQAFLPINAEKSSRSSAAGVNMSKAGMRGFA